MASRHSCWIKAAPIFPVRVEHKIPPSFLTRTFYRISQTVAMEWNRNTSVMFSLSQLDWGLQTKRDQRFVPTASPEHEIWAVFRASAGWRLTPLPLPTHPVSIGLQRCPDQKASVLKTGTGQTTGYKTELQRKHYIGRPPRHYTCENHIIITK